MKYFCQTTKMYNLPLKNTLQTGHLSKELKVGLLKWYLTHCYHEGINLSQLHNHEF